MDIEKQIEYLKLFATEKRFEKLNAVLQNRTRHVTVVLEDIFQGHNASAVLRSCDCFGIQDVYLIEHRNEFKTNEEVSMGANQWLTIHRYKEKNINNAEICFHDLIKKGYKILATVPRVKSIKIQEIDLSEPIAMVFGTEKEGLSEYALSHAHQLVHIPMYGFTESLNISVSVAICLYELSCRLRYSTSSFQLSEKEKKEVLLQWLKNSIRDADQILSRM